MKNLHRTLLPTLILALAVLTHPGAAAGAPAVFSDDFDTDTAANWDVFNASGTGTPDFTVQFNYNYGATKYTQKNLRTGATVTNLIPPAPNSTGGTTRGVKITVNKNDDVADTAAVSLYPKGQSFSGNYALRFDMWINYNGGPGGGTGSTEFGIFGINHTGTQVNWQANETAGDGLWFAATGEGGAALDYRSYEYDGFLSINLPVIDAGLIGGNAGDAVYQERFPHPEYESAGSPGKHWVQGEVIQKDGMIIWKLNGYVIAERANATPFTSGNVMIGCMDVFTSIADPKADNFILFDNVRVVNLNLEGPVATVNVEATDADASEPGTNTGTFTVSRTGASVSPLTVNYALSGDAQAGADYRTNTSSVTIPAGASSATVIIAPIDDFKGEQAETVNLTLVSGPDYEMRSSVRATVTIADDGDVTAVSLAATDAHIYERINLDIGRFEVIRSGDASGDLTVNLAVGGTASQGVDYETIGSTVVIPAGSTNATITVTAIDDALVEGEETVVLSLASGAQYGLGAQTNATLAIRDDDLPPAPVLFSDDFDLNSSGNWKILFGANNGIADYAGEFAYDYSADGIPSAPHSTGGSTKGLKVTVNKQDATATGAAGINLYPIGQRFTGNYAVRFDMYFSVGTDVGGTTEHAIFGINHSGALTNRHAAAGSDGLWFAVNGDGSNNRAYASYVSTDPGVAPTVLIRVAPDFAPFFTRPPFFSSDTPGAPSNDPNSANKIWVDVEISQVGNLVTWKINEVVLFQRTNTFGFNSGNLMLGYNDQFNSIGSLNNYVIYDNVRVVSLATTPSEPPTIRNIQLLANNQVQINFTSASGQASEFSLQSAASLGAPISWQDETAAVISASGPTLFGALLAREGDARFYRIKR